MAPSATILDTEYESSFLNRETLIVNENHNHGGQVSRELVKDALKERAGTVNTDICEPGEEVSTITLARFDALPLF